MSTADPRTQVLQQRLSALRDRIQRATAAAGRGTAPTLIVVTKYHPAADVLRLRGLGVADVGENRDQEAAQKARDVADPALRWHFIGQLQSNKAKSVARYAHAVHSLDRPGLITALGNALAAGPPRPAIDCFLQVDLSQTAPAPATTEFPAARGGALPADIPALARQVAATAGLRLAGVMAVAPLGGDPTAAFTLLAEVSAAVRREHPGAVEISAGMSADLEQAIALGATHLRVGSDVLGPRPEVR